MNISPFDTFVDRSQSDSIKWQKFDESVIPMWVADMEFATPVAVTRAMSRRIEHPIFGYTSAPPSLVESVATYCASRHQWTIDTDCFSWIPGVLPAITAAVQIAGAAGDEIIVFPPVYHPLLHIPAKNGKTRVDVPLVYKKDEVHQGGSNTGKCSGEGAWKIDFDSLEAAFTTRTAAILLSSPHNPMGVMFSEDELFKLAALCAKRNVLLISDEIHCDLILSKEKKHIPTALAAGEHHQCVITIMSPSKTFNLAGANCSFVHIADPDLRKKFNAECLYTVPFVPTLSYTAAEAAYSHGWEWHAQLIDYLRGNHDYLHSIINNTELLSMDTLDATYLAWIDTRRLMSEDANDFFKNAGVGLSPGSQFGDKNYQRLNFACSRGQLEQGVERMLSVL